MELDVAVAAHPAEERQLRGGAALCGARQRHLGRHEARAPRPHRIRSLAAVLDCAC